MPSNFSIGIALGAVYLIWGSTYLAMRVAIETIPPFMMAATRFLVAGIFFYLIAEIRKDPRESALQWRNAFIIGFFLLLVGNGLVAWSEQYISSGLAALLVSTVTIWMVVLNWAGWDRKRPSGWTALGLVLGFIGLVLLLKPANGIQVSLKGALAAITATLGWAIGSLTSRRVSWPASFIRSTGMQMICGGVFLYAASFMLGEWNGFQLAEVTRHSLLALGYLIVLGAMVGFGAYAWLIRSAPVRLVATYAYVNPVVAVILGHFLMGEIVTAHTLSAAAVILTAVALITVKK